MSKLNLKNIKKKFPSICFDCEYSRKPASNANFEKGYSGCCGRVMQESFDHDVIEEGEEVAEGWVDLKKRIGELKGSGMITNFQLLTKGIVKCTQFTPVDKI